MNAEGIAKGLKGREDGVERRSNLVPHVLDIQMRVALWWWKLLKAVALILMLITGLFVCTDGRCRSSVKRVGIMQKRMMKGMKSIKKSKGCVARIAHSSQIENV